MNNSKIERPIPDIMHYESKIWDIADLLRSASVKQSDFPTYMMPFFALVMLEGRMIALVGAVLGIVIGVTLCLIQQWFGIIKFGKSAGSYIIDVYPVSVHAWDLVVVFLTVVIVGFVSVWYPVRRLSKKYTTIQHS